MLPEDFVDAPWIEKSQHGLYKDSFLHMRPAPEYATGEVVLASTYRNVGFSKDTISEGRVPATGRELQKRLEKANSPRARERFITVPPETWKRIVEGTLRSPKQPSQSARRFLQISPVVPDAALYSQSARLVESGFSDLENRSIRHRR